MILLALACFGGGKEDSNLAVDTQPDSITYPTQDRILFYDGHGGEPGDSVGNGGSNIIEAWLNSQGYNAERRDNLGEPEKFRLIMLMDPGVKEPYAFQDADVEKLQVAMKTGTRIGIVMSNKNCEGTTINPLLEKLGAEMRLTGENAPTTLITNAVGGDQMTEGVSEVYLGTPCTVETNGAEPLLIIDRDTYAARERPGWGGDIVMVGDFSWMDDTDQLDVGDNRLFMQRMAEVGP